MDYICAGCGQDLGNGGVDVCVIISGAKNGEIYSLRLCLTGMDGAKGCAARLLPSKKLPHA